MFSYSLLITANPVSDSKSSIAIFEMIKRLDLLSRDITVYLPGFHEVDKTDKDSNEERQQILDAIQNANEKDAHNLSLIHIYCESAGDMYFNEADFTKFVFDLEECCPTFTYFAQTALLVLPAMDGDIQWERVKDYDLDIFFEQGEASKNHLEKFLLKVIDAMRRGMSQPVDYVQEQIDTFYNQLSGKEGYQDVSTVKIKLDSKILEHMKWRDSDEIFFISYSSQDEFDAFSLKYLLEKQGKHVWIAPDGIPAGFDYASVIPAALRLTSRFVVLLSDNSANSGWVRREIGKAITNKIKIDGILLNQFTMQDLAKYDDFSFLLENVQITYSLSDLFNENTFNKFIKTL